MNHRHEWKAERHQSGDAHVIYCKDRMCFEQPSAEQVAQSLNALAGLGPGAVPALVEVAQQAYTMLRLTKYGDVLEAAALRTIDELGDALARVRLEE